MTESSFQPYSEFRRFDADLMCQRAAEFASHMQSRRTVRDFSPDPVPPHVIDRCLQVARSAPSGANQQPWTFVVVESPEIRRQIREAAESEETEFYERRAPDEWLDALAPLGTNADKPFFEVAPVVICVFAQNWQQNMDGSRTKHYYVAESVGIAVGFLLCALHQAGLATLTHTPAPMKFLNRILNRPDNERPYLILIAGFPKSGCQVPVITKRDEKEVVVRC
jgi:iodotyrosine deiodinase